MIIIKPNHRSKISDMVWVKQKFCITNGVPLSMKFDPNFIFSTPHAIFSFLNIHFRVPLLPAIFASKVCRNFVEILFTHDANVNTRRFTPTESTKMRGKRRKPGISISPRIFMQTYCDTICNVGMKATIAGTVRTMRNSLKDVSKSWVQRYMRMQFRILKIVRDFFSCLWILKIYF